MFWVGTGVDSSITCKQPGFKLALTVILGEFNQQFISLAIAFASPCFASCSNSGRFCVTSSNSSCHAGKLSPILRP